MGIAKEVAKGSTCLRRKIGAVIVRDDQIVSTGYVGASLIIIQCCEQVISFGFYCVMVCGIVYKTMARLIMRGVIE